VHKRIISAVKRIEFVRDRTSTQYQEFAGVASLFWMFENKTNDVETFYVELERVFNNSLSTT
jgi:hypothetical protein